MELIPVSALGLTGARTVSCLRPNGEEPLRLQMLDPNPVQAEGANGSMRNSATTIPLWLTERQRAFFHSTCNWVFNLGGDEVTFALILLSSDRMATVSPVLVRRNIPLPP